MTTTVTVHSHPGAGLRCDVIHEQYDTTKVVKQVTTVPVGESRTFYAHGGAS